MGFREKEIKKTSEIRKRNQLIFQEQKACVDREMKIEREEQEHKRKSLCIIQNVQHSKVARCLCYQ